MKPTTKFGLVAALFAAAFVAIGVITFLNRGAPTGSTLVSEVVQPSRPVQTLTLVPRRLEETFDSSSVLRAKRDVNVMAEVPGTVRAVHKDLGDPCKAGQALVQLGAESYGAAAQQSRAALEQARVGGQGSGRARSHTRAKAIRSRRRDPARPGARFQCRPGCGRGHEASRSRRAPGAALGP